MNIQPLSDYVLLEFFSEELKTKSGLLVPQTAQDQKAKIDLEPEEGTVVAASKGDKNDKGESISLEVKAGNKVMFFRYHTREIEIRSKKYLLIRNRDLVAIVK